MSHIDPREKIEMLKKQYLNRVNFLRGVYKEKIQKIIASINVRRLAEARKDLGL